MSDVIYARDLDGSGSMHICAKGDPGAVAYYAEAPRSATAAIPTEEMLESVRGILQIIRNRPGAACKDVREHCRLRGEAVDRWPSWIAETDGYVTESDAARMIYEVMQAFAPKGTAARVEVAALQFITDLILICRHEGIGGETLDSAQAYVDGRRMKREQS